MRGRKPSGKQDEEGKSRIRLMPPPGLTKGARTIWDHLEPKIPNLVPAHTHILADLCSCIDVTNRLQKRVNREGYVLKGCKGQKIKNPALQILREYRLAVQRYATEFGLTPVAILRLTGQGAGTDGGKTPPAGRGKDPDDPLNGRFQRTPPELVN